MVMCRIGERSPWWWSQNQSLSSYLLSISTNPNFSPFYLLPLSVQHHWPLSSRPVLWVLALLPLTFFSMSFLLWHIHCVCLSHHLQVRLLSSLSFDKLGSSWLRFPFFFYDFLHHNGINKRPSSGPITTLQHAEKKYNLGNINVPIIGSSIKIFINQRPKARIVQH